MMETEDIIFGKAKYEDWRSIYRNVWSRPETAEYMLWLVDEHMVRFVADHEMLGGVG